MDPKNYARYANEHFIVFRKFVFPTTILPDVKFIQRSIKFLISNSCLTFATCPTKFAQLLNNSSLIKSK